MQHLAAGPGVLGVLGQRRVSGFLVAAQLLHLAVGDLLLPVHVGTFPLFSRVILNKIVAVEERHQSIELALGSTQHIDPGETIATLHASLALHALHPGAHPHLVSGRIHGLDRGHVSHMARLQRASEASISAVAVVGEIHLTLHEGACDRHGAHHPYAAQTRGEPAENPRRGQVR